MKSSGLYRFPFGALMFAVNDKVDAVWFHASSSLKYSLFTTDETSARVMVQKDSGETPLFMHS